MFISRGRELFWSCRPRQFVNIESEIVKIHKKLIKMNSWSQNNTNSNGEDGDLNDETDESNTEAGEIDYKSQYEILKKKLKFLIYVSLLITN